MTRIPKQAELTEMTEEQLKANAVAPVTTSLLRAVYLKELTRRDYAAAEKAEIEKDLDPTNEVAFKIGVMRRTIKRIVLQFAEGALLGTQAAWKIHLASGISYKWGEKVLEAGYEYHLASGIQERDGVQAADQRRNLIEERAKKAWKLLMDGTAEEIELFVADPKNSITEEKLPKEKKGKKGAPPVVDIDIEAMADSWG